jgi:hypothetical protein
MSAKESKRGKKDRKALEQEAAAVANGTDGNGSLNGGLADQLAEVRVESDAVTSDQLPDIPDMGAIVKAHAKTVEDVPVFRKKLEGLLRFLTQYESADLNSQAQAKASWQDVTRAVYRMLFENTSIITRQLAWEMVLVSKFQRTLGSIAEIVRYLANLCTEKYLVESKSGSGSLWAFVERYYDTRARILVEAHNAYYNFPELAEFKAGGEQEKLVVDAFKGMIARAETESRKRWEAAMPDFIKKYSGGIAPEQYANREIGHCMFWIPSGTEIRKDDRQVWMEGGRLVMQNKAEQTYGKDGKPRKEVRSYVVAFLNDSDSRCTGKFEVTLRACAMLRPPVYIDPAWATGKGCPKLQGNDALERIGEARWIIAKTVQKGYQAWVSPTAEGEKAGQGESND